MTLGQTIDQIAKEKNIDPHILIGALEDAMVAAAKKYYKTGEELHARYNRETGTVEVFAVKNIVGEVADPLVEMSLEDARKIDETFEVGDLVEFPKRTDVLGRIAAQTAKQVIFQKVREAERENVYNEYSQRVGELINGIVKRYEGPDHDCIVDIGKTEAILPRREQSGADSYKQGDRIRAVIIKVHKSAKGPQVVLSRRDPLLLVKLFEMEIPEVYDSTVVIKNAVREAGERAKVAVFSKYTEVDPVGACVGMKGSRINSIIRELRGEKIDIIRWSEDSAQFAVNALSPAQISKVIIVAPQKKVLEVIVDQNQLSLAIGKKGQNVRLAAKLLGWHIDIKSEEEKRREVEVHMARLEVMGKPISEVEGITERMAGSLVEAGIQTIDQLLKSSPEKLMEVPGIGEKTAAKLLNSAHQMVQAAVAAVEAPEEELAAEELAAEPAQVQQVQNVEADQQSQEREGAEEAPNAETVETAQGQGVKGATEDAELRED
ncbi:MAG: transcription termination/antitermination protein NusA [Acidobacteria bacterium]|nr:transcription termination/antitermination protein NusA [Acidobacteriota bacterium]